MKRLTCAVVEDEPLAIQMLTGYIARRADLELISVMDNVCDFHDVIKKIAPDLIFLDFQTPCFDGDIGKILISISTRSVIINISASPVSYFTNTLQKSLKRNVYELLKPFSFEKFNECIDFLLNK
ncbi:LytR/AlgR family response regulator transcription factor [Olivibacter domesticus]|uniref:Response regulator receiver domain-containing protein n=1 Tax=Olivibacter domesticus TaxID=407022 RepID=A0A1H7GIB0_OLID1|nr:response regulator [Olivibacter domesticus]SEK37821.1 Response regulator receiver domain-containing protein [Olivibacter domesticus]